MTGRSARAKGAGAEREVVDILVQHGYDAHRTPHSGALVWMPGDVTGVPGIFIEVKRCEQVRIDEWSEKAELQADGKVPVVVYRRSRQPWRVVLRLEDFLELMER